MLSWAAADDLTLVSEAATAIASEAKAIGINTIFAPVLDLVTESENPIINIRGFHSDPQKIAEFAQIFCLSIQKDGIACVAKHFPGHGKAKTDSHLEIPIINASFSDLVNNDILPFKQSIESGIKGLMIAHIQFKNTKLPVTFQYKILSDYLRNQLKFSGITFSDALNMKAVTNNFSVPEQVELGLKAGLDIFLMPEQFPLFMRP